MEKMSDMKMASNLAGFALVLTSLYSLVGPWVSFIDDENLSHQETLVTLANGVDAESAEKIGTARNLLVLSFVIYLVVYLVKLSMYKKDDRLKNALFGLAYLLNMLFSISAISMLTSVKSSFLKDGAVSEDFRTSFGFMFTSVSIFISALLCAFYTQRYWVARMAVGSYGSSRNSSF